MSTPSRRRTTTLRDGARVALRPIASGDKPLLAAVFERLSQESRYRRFFTTKNSLSAAELDYFVDVDHSNHEAIVAIDSSSGECLGVDRLAVAVESSPRPPVDSDRPIRTIVVGVDGSETGAKSLAVTLELAAALRATVHVVSAYGAVRTRADAEAALAAATRTAGAQGLEAVTHARNDEPFQALTVVAQEQDADLLVVGRNGASRASRFLMGGVAHKVSHHPPCSVLMVHADQAVSWAEGPPALSGPGD